jgi:hypothetical protein
MTRYTKKTVTLEEQLAETASELAPGGNFSAFVNEAVRDKVRRVRMGEYLVRAAGELGPVPESVRDEIHGRMQQFDDELGGDTPAHDPPDAPRAAA